MNVTFYTFSKKYNSTARPSGGAVYNCVLKRDSGIQHPYIELSGGATSNPTGYNYAYIAMYERFYYVNDWTFSNGLWSCALDIDVLATYKTQIGGTDLYILRASAAYDNSIVDTIYPATKGGTTITQTANTGWTRTYSAGSYVIGIISKSAVSGAVAYYVVTYSGMATLRAAMMNPGTIPNWSDIKDFTSGDIAKAFLDPFQYVASCTWFPFAVAGGSSAALDFGYWSSGVSGSVLSSGVQALNITFSVPGNYSSSADAWRRLAPFAEYTLYLPPFGLVTLDSTKVASSSNIYLNILIDVITGLATMDIYDDFNNILATVGAQLGVPVQLAQVSTDYAGMITGAASSVGGIVGGILTGNIGGAVQSAASGIVSAAQSAAPTVATSGSTGGTGGIGTVARFNAYFRNVTDYSNEIFGRPYCKVAKPSALGGYIMAQSGSIVSCDGNVDEREAIKQFIETGFYYE